MKIRPWLACLFCSVMVLAVFSRVLQNGFVNWDDPQHILYNPLLSALNVDSVRSIFFSKVSQVYVPLTILFFSIERQIWGLNPWIFHLNSLLLHTGVVILVFVFSRRLGLSVGGAAFAALLFGVHPLRVESVAWATARKDLLYSFFYLLCLCWYAQYVSGKTRFYFWLSLGAAVLSMLSKPMALSIPLVLLLYDWFCRRKGSWIIWEKIYFIALLAPLAMLTYAEFARFPQLSLGKGLLISTWCFAFYLKKFLWPSPLVLLYELPQPVGGQNPEYITGVIIFVLFFGSLWILRRHRLVVFGAVFFLCTIFYLLRFDYKTDFNIVADRFSYLPSLGFAWILGYSLDRTWRYLGKRGVVKSILASGVIGALLILSCLTSIQISVWKDSVALWENQSLYRPQAARPLVYYKLADAYSQQEPFKNAVIAFRQAKNLQAATKFSGDIPEKAAPEVERVIRLYQRAIELKPDFTFAAFQLGNIYRALGDEKRAAKYFNRVLYFDPGNPAALGALKMGRQ